MQLIGCCHAALDKDEQVCSDVRPVQKTVKVRLWLQNIPYWIVVNEKKG